VQTTSVDELLPALSYPVLTADARLVRLSSTVELGQAIAKTQYEDLHSALVPDHPYDASEPMRDQRKIRLLQLLYDDVTALAD
jgi:hypothetical protein